MNVKGGETMEQEIYTWLESYSGVAYDFTEDFIDISKECAFVKTFAWYCGILNIEENLNLACETIDNYGHMLPDNLPDSESLKRLLISNVLNNIIANLNHVKQSLNIDISEINDAKTITSHLNGLRHIIDILSDNSLSDKELVNIFNDYDEDNDGLYTETFSISKEDLPNMQFTISDIKQAYYDSLDEE